MAKYTIDGREVTIENLTNDDLIYRNFRGEGGAYNQEGKRNFNVVIRDEEVANRLADMQFRIKQKFNEDGAWVLKIHVNFLSKYPPEVTYVNGRKMEHIGESTAYILDKKKAECVDIRFIGSKSKKSRDEFLDAYLDSLYFVGKIDILKDKWDSYADEDDEVEEDFV